MAEVIAETERLRLRTWGEGDAEAFYAVMNTPAVMRYLGGLQSPAEWAAVVDRLTAYQRELGYTFWIAERREDRELLGWSGLKHINYPGAPNSGDMEIGWRFRESTWGQGIAKEAAIAALDLAFARFAAPYVVAVTFAVNKASWGLMERLEMRYIPELDFQDPRYADLGPSKQWRLDAHQWPAVRASLLR